MISKCVKLAFMKLSEESLETSDKLCANSLFGGLALHGVGACSTVLAFSRQTTNVHIAITPSTISIIPITVTARFPCMVSEHWKRENFKTKQASLENKRSVTCTVDPNHLKAAFDPGLRIIWTSGGEASRTKWKDEGTHGKSKQDTMTNKSLRLVNIVFIQQSVSS